MLRHHNNGCVDSLWKETKAQLAWGGGSEWDTAFIFTGFNTHFEFCSRFIYTYVN